MSNAITAVQYGLYDTETGLWMGNKEGPILHGDFMIARVAAQMCDVMLGQKPGRTKAKYYPPGPARLKDELKPRMSPEQALAGMESGRYI